MTTIRVRVTREYEVDPEAWAEEYDLARATVHDDLENYLGDRAASDADFPAFAETDGIVEQTRHTVLVGEGPRLMFAPEGVVVVALNRLRLALVEQRRDPALLLQQILTDLGVWLVVE